MARGAYQKKKADELAQLVAEMERRVAARDPQNFIKQEATPRQQAFLESEALEALYGGAAGGGKSSALLIAALQYVHVPNYSALILRRTFTDLSLPGSIMDRAREWLTGTGAQWNDRDKRWTFPSGATLQFGFCDTEKDKYRYQGTEIQFLGVDELTQWPEEWYRYLLSRLRKRENMDVPLRARCASNPGGIGHHWVRRRFVDPQTAIGDYVPAKLDDNPHLDQHSYKAALALLDVQTRSQLLDGNWVEDASGLVYKYDSAKNDVSFTPPLDNYVIGVDYGVTDATAACVLGWAKNDPTVYVVDIFKQSGLIPSEAAEMVRSLSIRYKPERIVGDMGGLGKGFIEEARRRFYLPIEAADKQNKRGFQALLNGALERGELRLLQPMCKPLSDEWAELPWNDARTKEADGFDNHCFVAGTMIATPSGEVPVELVLPGDLVMTRNGPRRVKASARTGKQPIWRLETSDGRTLLGTPNHPIWTAERQWVDLSKLVTGETLLTPAGKVKVFSLLDEARHDFVFNLSVETDEEYFANGILVHNCSDATLYAWRACRSYTERAAAGPLSHAEVLSEQMREHEEQIVARIRSERERENEAESMFGGGFFSGGEW